MEKKASIGQDLNPYPLDLKPTALLTELSGHLYITKKFFQVNKQSYFQNFVKKKFLNHKSWATLWTPLNPIEILTWGSAWDGTL